MCFNRFVISIMMVCLLAVTVSTPSGAEELKAVGKASVKVTSDESTAYKRALKNAKKDAVRELAIKVIGPEAGKDETITDALDSLADQLDEYFDDEETDTVDDKVEVKITARIEASEFRSLMREQGIKGSNTSAAAVKIAVMIDEYVTVPTDFSQPESIKTFFKSSKKKFVFRPESAGSVFGCCARLQGEFQSKRRCAIRSGDQCSCKRKSECSVRR